MATVLIPDFQDEVKHKLNDTTGVVIAIYEKDGKTYLDVRADDRIYYETPRENWVVTAKNEE
jgi:archaeosine-15-forming tRNA-guanine transglycosylase